MEENKDEFDMTLDKKISEIFKESNYTQFSKFQRRKMIFDYLVDNLEYDFELLTEIYDYKPRDYKSEIMSGLNEGKKNEEGKGLAVCNGISYGYKLLLEKVGIESLLIASNIEVDNPDSLGNLDVEHITKSENGKYKLGHMFILVKNEDGTFSFDDPTCNILHRNEGINWFNYELSECAEKKQVDIKGMSSELLYYFVGREKPESDKRLESRLAEDDSGFINLPQNIKSYKEPEKIQEDDDWER